MTHGNVCDHPEYSIDGLCVICSTPFPPEAEEETDDTDISDAITCHHCLRIVPAEEAVPAKMAGQMVFHCFSCGTGLPYDTFKRLKMEGLPLPTYSKEP